MRGLNTLTAQETYQTSLPDLAQSSYTDIEGGSVSVSNESCMESWSPAQASQPTAFITASGSQLELTPKQKDRILYHRHLAVRRSAGGWGVCVLGAS